MKNKETRAQQKNRKTYKNGARTDAPKPSNKDTRVHKTQDVAFLIILLWGVTMRGLETPVHVVSWGRKKWGSIIHPQTASNGVQLRTRRRQKIRILGKSEVFFGEPTNQRNSPKSRT